MHDCARDHGVLRVPQRGGPPARMILPLAVISNLKPPVTMARVQMLMDAYEAGIRQKAKSSSGVEQHGSSAVS